MATRGIIWPRDILPILNSLLKAIEATTISEIAIAKGPVRVSVHRQVLQPGPRRQLPSKGRVDVFIPIVVPLTGTFYRSPAPNSPPFVEEGGWVDAGEIIGLIETMKVFNEIHSEVAGQIVAIKAKSGELVHAGQVLMEVAPPA